MYAIANSILAILNSAIAIAGHFFQCFGVQYLGTQKISPQKANDLAKVGLFLALWQYLAKKVR